MPPSNEMTWAVTKEVLNQMPPFVDLTIDVQRCLALWHLRDDDLGASVVQLVDDPVRVKRLVGDQSFKLGALDQRGDADRVVSLPRQQDETDEIAQCIGQRQDFGCQAASGAANSLALRPPFAPWP